MADNQNDWDSQLPKASFAFRTTIHATTHFSAFHLTFDHSPKLPVDLMMAHIQPSKLHSYPQFVWDSHKQLTSSYATAKQQPQAQHLQQKCLRDSNRSSESFQVGNRIWIYIPVVNQGCTRKFSSFWNVHTLLLISLTYTVQLIGDTQILVVQRNRMKPCLTPPLLQTDIVTA